MLKSLYIIISTTSEENQVAVNDKLLTIRKPIFASSSPSPQEVSTQQSGL